MRFTDNKHTTCTCRLGVGFSSPHAMGGVHICIAGNLGSMVCTCNTVVGDWRIPYTNCCVWINNTISFYYMYQNEYTSANSSNNMFTRILFNILVGI